MDRGEAVTVTVGSTTPTVDNYDELKAAYASADLPRRLIMPAENRGTNAETEFAALGKTIHTTHRIVDLLLYKPATQEKYATVAAWLVSYIEAYRQAMQAQRSLGLSNTALLGWTSTISIETWGDTPCWAVTCELRVQEYESA